MSNALFLSSRWLDAATVTASSVQGLLSADHVQTIRPYEVWRATGCTLESLIFDHGEPALFEAGAFIAHNLTAAGMIGVKRAASLAGLASPSFTLAPVSAWPASGKPTVPNWPSYISLILTGDDDEYQFTQIDFIDPTNPAGFVEVGRAIGGPTFVPAHNVDINPSLGLISADEVGTTAFNQTFGDDRGPKRRAFQVPMSAIDEDEMGDELFELQRHCGGAGDFAFCLDPAADARFHRYSGQFRFSALNTFTAQPFWTDANKQIWQTTLALEEIL